MLSCCLACTYEYSPFNLCCHKLFCALLNAWVRLVVSFGPRNAMSSRTRVLRKASAIAGPFRRLIGWSPWKNTGVLFLSLVCFIYLLLQFLDPFECLPQLIGESVALLATYAGRCGVNAVGWWFDFHKSPLKLLRNGPPSPAFFSGLFIQWAKVDDPLCSCHARGRFRTTRSPFSRRDNPEALRRMAGTKFPSRDGARLRCGITRFTMLVKPMKASNGAARRLPAPWRIGNFGLYRCVGLT